MPEKVSIIYQITQTKISEATIFIRTQETLRQHISMLLQNESLNEKVNLSMIYAQLPGLYTPTQISQLNTAKNDGGEIALYGDLVENSSSKNGGNGLLKNEIESLVKLVWSYLVYCSQRIRSGDRYTVDFALISSGNQPTISQNIILLYRYIYDKQTTRNTHRYIQI